MIEMRRVPVRRLGAVAAGVVLLAGVGGCGESDPAAEAVRVAAMQMETLSLTGANPAPSREHRLETFRQIVSRLQPHTGGEAGGTKSAANLLMARAQAGLAGMKFEELADAQRRTLDAITSIRGLLDRYLNAQVMVTALEQYDPGPELAELDDRIRSRDEEIAEVLRQKQALEKELSGLEARAAAELEKARAQRMEETSLRQQAVNARAVEQAALIEQAAEHKRVADAHDKEASLLRAQITQRAPEVGEFETLIGRLTEQRRLLDEAKAEVQARAKAKAERAAEARAAAMQAAEEIKKRLASLDELRQPVEGLTKEVTEGYQSAARACTAAGSIGEARLGVASNQHALADVLALRAQTERAYAKLLRDLADATPSLSGIADLRARADGAEQKAIDLAAKAAEALNEAKDAYTNAGSRAEETRQRLESLNQKLQELSDVRKDPSKIVEESAPSASVAEAPAASEPADETARVEADIRAMLRELAAAEARGDDFASIRRYLHATTPAGKQFIQFGETVGAASREFKAALQEKFGSDLDEKMAGMNQMMPDFGFSEEVEITVLGPTAAALNIKGQPVTFGVVKADGVWKLDVDSLAATLGVMMGPMMKMGEPLAEAFRQLAADIRAGTYSTIEEVQQAMMTRMQTLMMQSGGG